MGQQPEPERLRRGDEVLQHQARVDGRVHEHVERVVGKGPATHLGHPPHAPMITAEHREERSGGDPRHVGNPATDGGLLRAILDEDDGHLLQV